MMCLKRWKVTVLIMADFNLFYKKYNSFLSTFKATSLDNYDKSKPNKYLCFDTSQQVINFDKIVEDKYPDSNMRPKAFDAIFFDEKENIIYLIEFKNQKKPDKEEVEGKLLDGKKEFDLLLSGLNISKDDYKIIFCLVYDKYHPKHERHKRGLFKSLTFEFLEQHKKSCLVNDIYTEDVTFFTKQFKKKTLKELAC